MKAEFLETVEITDPEDKRYKPRTVWKGYIGKAEEADGFYIITLPDGYRTKAPKDAIGDVYRIIEDGE